MGRFAKNSQARSLGINGLRVGFSHDRPIPNLSSRSDALVLLPMNTSHHTPYTGALATIQRLPRFTRIQRFKDCPRGLARSRTATPTQSDLKFIRSFAAADV